MAENEVAVLLSGVPLFAGLASRQLALLAERVRGYSYRRGEVIFHQGDPAGSLHVIRRGSVKVTAPTARGAEPVLALLGPGACFGEVAALDGGLRSATVTAVEPTETLALHRDTLWACVREQPEFAERVILTLVASVRRINTWLEDAYFNDLDTRMARRLYELAATRGQTGVDGVSLQVSFPLSQSELAGMLGATRASVNAILGIYQDAGLLRLGRGSFTVPHPEDLRRRAGLE
jgi:CRP-like cAMP-binding protein